MKSRQSLALILTDFGVQTSDVEYALNEILYAPRTTKDYQDITRASIRSGKIRVDTPDGEGLVVDVDEPTGAPAKRWVRVYLDNEADGGVRIKNYTVSSLFWQ